MEEDTNIYYNTKLIEEILEDSRRASENKGIVTGVRTGFYDLDYMTAGLQKGELVMLLGRLGSGKTSLALSIVNAVLKDGKTVAYFSLSHSAKKIMTGLLSMNSEVKVWDISNGTVNEDDLEKLKSSSEVVKGLPIYIEDTSYSSGVDICSMCRMLKRKGGLDFIVIDGFQYVAPGTCTTQHDIIVQRSEIMYMLKELAVEMECPILLVSNLAQFGDTQDSKRPDISDISATDYVALYSDVIMFLHKIDENEFDLILAKNRSGREGVVKLRPKLEFSKFVNYTL